MLTIETLPDNVVDALRVETLIAAALMEGLRRRQGFSTPAYAAVLVQQFAQVVTELNPQATAENVLQAFGGGLVTLSSDRMQIGTLDRDHAAACLRCEAPTPNASDVMEDAILHANEE